MIRPKFIFQDQHKQTNTNVVPSQSYLIEHSNLFQNSAEESKLELNSNRYNAEIRRKTSNKQTTLTSNNSKMTENTEKHHLDVHPEVINNDHSQLQQTNKVTSNKISVNLAVPQLQRQRKKSTSYEQKADMFHKGAASQLKPNLLLAPQNGNASPVLQNYSNYSFKPQQNQKAYDPHDQRMRTKKIKIESRIASSKKTKVQELPLEDRYEENKRMEEILSENSSNLAYIHDQAAKVIKKPELSANSKIYPCSQQKIQQILKEVINKVESNTEFQLQRQQKCGLNYLNPDFKILRKDGSAVISAKKQFGHFNSYYQISSEQIVLGCLRGNFGGTEFNLYRTRANQQELVATIVYQTSFLCGSDFRRIQTYIKNDDQSNLMFAGQTKRKNLKELFDEGYTQNIKKFATKQPKLCPITKCFILNFKGKGKLPSIKNMILSPQKQANKSGLLFCKKDKDSFHVEIDSSLSIFISMGILMSSFDFKLFCQ